MIFAGGVAAPRQLTDAQRAQVKRVSEHMKGVAHAAEILASPDRSGHQDAAPDGLTPDQAFAAMVARDATAWRA